jgi:N-acetylglutamate synthase-like GNAT family acetyltransferase
MDRIVVHPAYWKRGHGRKLVKLGTALADVDQVDQGVLATTMGAALFSHIRSQDLTNVHVERKEEALEGLSIVVLRYTFQAQCEPKVEM